jgi:4-hydroxy-3-polyprenylbenzoate decarboxylase
LLAFSWRRHEPIVGPVGGGGLGRVRGGLWRARPGGLRRAGRRAAALTLKQELDLSLADLAAKASVTYRAADVGAAIASGSFKTLGMIIAPCSVRTASEIATGVTSSLLTRAADVILKERRPLVLMVRETPLHLGHLRTLVRLAEMGAIIAPPLPAFYIKPASVQALIDQSVGRCLDLFGLSWAPVRRWGEDVGPLESASEGADEGGGV